MEVGTSKGSEKGLKKRQVKFSDGPLLRLLLFDFCGLRKKAMDRQIQMSESAPKQDPNMNQTKFLLYGDWTLAWLHFSFFQRNAEKQS